MFIFIVLIGSIVCAFLCSNVAKAKGYSSSSWFLAGLFFGVLALLAVAGLPNQKLTRYLRYIAEKQGITNEDLNKIDLEYNDSSNRKKRGRGLGGFLGFPDPSQFDKPSGNDK